MEGAETGTLAAAASSSRGSSTGRADTADAPVAAAAAVPLWRAARPAHLLPHAAWPRSASRWEQGHRRRLPPLAGREHISFRSAYFPVRDVIDGDLCEQYPQVCSVMSFFPILCALPWGWITVFFPCAASSRATSASSTRRCAAYLLTEMRPMSLVPGT